jgi:hypothetical protein
VQAKRSLAMLAAAALVLLILPMPPGQATTCPPGDSAPPRVKSAYTPRTVELSTSEARQAFWTGTFLLNATVEDDRETALVWMEFYDIDSEWVFSIILGNKKVLSKNATREVSHWSKVVSILDEKDIVEGDYEVTVRAHDACLNVYVTEEGKIPSMAVDPGDGEYPLPAYPGTALNPSEPGLRLRGYEDKPIPDPLPLGPGEFLQLNISSGRLREATYEVHFRPGMFTTEQPLKSPYSLGQELLLNGTQDVIFRAHSRLLDEGTFELVVRNVTVDTQAPKVVKIRAPAEKYAGIPFPLAVDMWDEFETQLTLRAVGDPLGSMVDVNSADRGLPLVPLDTAAVRWLDMDDDLKLSNADTVFLDIEEPLRRVSVGDVILTGPLAGTLVDGTHPDLGKALTTPANKPRIGYMEGRADGVYGAEDLVIIDDAGGTGVDVGKLSRFDVYISGARLGRFATATEAASEVRPIQHNILGLWAYRDLDGSGTLNKGDAVYLASGANVAPGDIRIVPAFTGLDLKASGPRGSYTYDLTVTLPEARDYKLTLEIRDRLGNTHVSSHDLTVQPTYTQFKFPKLEVLTKNPLAGQKVEFLAVVNQTDGVGTLPIRMVYEGGGNQGVREANATLKTLVETRYNATFLPAQKHNLSATIAVPEGVAVRPGSMMERQVQFEVFFGRVDSGPDSYYIRASNKVPLPGSAVLNPGGGVKELVYDLWPVAEGARTVYVFNATSGQLKWDPFQKNAAGEAVTVAQPTTEPKDKDSPNLPFMALLVAVGVAVLLRRRGA